MPLALYLPAPYFPAEYFGQPSSATPIVVPIVRDWDIFDDIIARLKAIAAFDGVYASDDPTLDGKSAGLKAIAVVSPVSATEEDGWDDPTDIQWQRKVTWSLAITARNVDPRLRDRSADRLMNRAKNAINEACLAGVTFPALTTLGADRYAVAIPPSRTITAVGSFVYFIDGSSGHATDL